MKVLISGASGMVGKALKESLEKAGHDVYSLVRRQPKDNTEIRWSPIGGIIDTEALEALSPDAVVNLAGEPIFTLWTTEKKESILKSRAKGTQFLSEALSKLENKPQVMVSASAIGYYGNRGDDVMTETSEPGAAIQFQPRNKPFFLFDKKWGADFLSHVCQNWEEATQPARDAGIRVVNLRIGVVLSTKGGALAQMLTPFKAGVAGPLGNGKQYMSWVSLDDLVNMINFSINTPDLKGPVNAVAPTPVTNKDFTRQLSDKAFIAAPLRGMANIVPAPSLGLKLALGEMGNAILLSSTRVKPMRLEEAGYKFIHADLSTALKDVLKN